MSSEIEKSNKLFIGGEWRDGEGGKTFGTFCPANGELLSSCAVAGKGDVDLAVNAAWTAFEAWKDASVSERSGVLFKIADLIEKNARKLSMIETMDNGMPLRESSSAIVRIADTFRYFGGVVRAEEGGAALLDKETLSMIIREPIGVVGAIIPWNSPLFLAAWKIAPALAVGDTIVIKSSSETPLSLLELTKNAREVAIIGATAGILPEVLFEHGVTLIGGVKIVDAVKMMQVVSEGGGTPALKSAVKFVTIKSRSKTK